MIARVRAEQGFSLTELLVVVIIVGILAAIAIPNFLLEQGKAHGVNAKAAAREAVGALEVYSIDHHGYAGVTRADLEQIEPSLRQAHLTISSTEATYQLDVTSDSAPPVIFTANRDHGQMERTCSNPGVGGCLDAGTW